MPLFSVLLYIFQWILMNQLYIVFMSLCWRSDDDIVGKKCKIDQNQTSTDPTYRQISNISGTLVDDKIVGHLDVVVQLHPHFWLNTGLQWIGQRHLQEETRNIEAMGFGASYIKGLAVCYLWLVLYEYIIRWTNVATLVGCDCMDTGHDTQNIYNTVCWLCWYEWI